VRMPLAGPGPWPRPFVETLPTSGKERASVRILGTDLRGATSVSFNGTPATFQGGIALHHLGDSAGRGHLRLRHRNHTERDAQEQCEAPSQKIGEGGGRFGP
jgi:hypothetical protein